jgi:hypothetical protein
LVDVIPYVVFIPEGSFVLSGLSILILCFSKLVDGKPKSSKGDYGRNYNRTCRGSGPKTLLVPQIFDFKL